MCNQICWEIIPLFNFFGILTCGLVCNLIYKNFDTGFVKMFQVGKGSVVILNRETVGVTTTVYVNVCRIVKCTLYLT